MPNRHALIIPAAALAAMLLAGCATDPETPRNKLTLTGSPVTAPFAVGDTSALWTADKVVILSNGRESPTRNYPSFHIESTDTTVAAVVLGRLLVARKPGTAEITAHDDKSELASESSVKVTVVAAP